MHVKNLDVVFLHSVSNQRLSDAKFSDKVLTIFTAAQAQSLLRASVRVCSARRCSAA